MASIVAMSELRGRIVALRHTERETRMILRSWLGTQEVMLDSKIVRAIPEGSPLQIGDLVVVEGEPKPTGIRRLTASLRPGETTWMERTLDPRRLHAVRIRSEVERGIRDFFLERGFLETRTPLLVPSPGMEIHIRPFELKTGAFLPTSPEFAMKRLLVGGLEKIFQICPSYRYEPNSTTHHPEFTMLEWYRAYADVAAIQADTELLVESLAVRIHGKPEIRFGDRTISVKTPWPRLRVRDLFAEIGVDLVAANTPEALAKECRRLGVAPANVPLDQDTWDDLYFRIWLNRIEPNLPADRAVFVERYPRSQAALAVLDRDPDGSEWAKRFEFYIAGLELGNAFEELTDAKEQRARFVRDMREREAIYGDSFPVSPIDEEFLGALEEGMPPSGGIAVGVDRLVMLLADEPDIEKTLWLRSFPGSEEPHPVIGVR
jgi:lysyl-tRNA synthetase class 2